MKTFFLIISFALVFTNILFSQSPYTNIQISSFASPEEPSICINPKNTNIIVAGANISSYYYSTNAGLSWTTGTLVSTYTVWGDPILTVDTSGNFYYFHLVNGPNGFIDRMGVQKSTDGGANWTAGTFYSVNPPKQQDKEDVAVDWTHGPRGNWIYSTWTQFDAYGSHTSTDSSVILFARSTDAGNSFGSIVRLSTIAGDCVDSKNTQEGAMPAVGPNGEIYVCWAGPLSPGNYKIFFTKSTDGGTTWSPNTVAATQIGGWDYSVTGIYRNNGLPCTLCDLSNGPYRGNIYVNYTDSAGPADHDVKVVRSTNGGVSWGTPVRVNDDPPGKEQFFSWMAVDQTTGFLYVVFYDRRNYTDTQTDVYMAHSTNGGVTWINERISSSPFIPTSNVFFGDYNGISAANGIIRPMWTRLQSNSLSVWTAIINFPVGIQPISNTIPEKFNLSQNYPNPFNPSTNIRFDIPLLNKEGSGVVLKVYDILGKEAATLVNGNYAPGSYEIKWDASALASGVYYYTLSAGNFKETKKMVLTK